MASSTIELTARKDGHFGEFGKLVVTVDVSPVAYKSARKCAGGSSPPLSTIKPCGFRNRP